MCDGLYHKLDHSRILSAEQKNLGGNTDRLAPIQKSPIRKVSMFGSRVESDRRQGYGLPAVGGPFPKISVELPWLVV
jgi:hypothetical protein